VSAVFDSDLDGAEAIVALSWNPVAATGILDSELCVLRQLLSKDPEQRFETPSALLEALHSESIKGSFIDCAECSKRYQIKPILAGKKVRCKECGETISIPHSL
jgi:ribosomal protein S27E